ncbi:MAG: hypothetical protein IPH44_22580 [Myxococcales bacterium]|nr:hypothetical protein [Myxococcales bacterium]
MHQPSSHTVKKRAPARHFHSTWPRSSSSLWKSSLKTLVPWRSSARISS